ncbi:unnamed protein product [Adineta steineri]|uniref:Uncharacterized protein n=1 Tax=Adineta steineri TaxID=433720 RepID=A0A819DXM4_9BILA|nr:unnamed protein product [Adineta steineri]CAF3840793.1 unnamed protein product [Adineta steineri]CAF4068746.1 unnamed protein product [Adineta steineri]
MVYYCLIEDFGICVDIIDLCPFTEIPDAQKIFPQLNFFSTKLMFLNQLYINIVKFICTTTIQNTFKQLIVFSLGQTNYLNKNRINLRIWLNNNKSILIYLYPFSYYDLQYQNQRISLTINIQSILEYRQILFGIIH